ncbi:MAG: hypothetical protein A2Z29_04710 [Chloroflexi bacterium RBG_16_56_11]|nr:MAG: hypothetical protein A2Z29_04710 [Chloroflexi bacterium RBG_16_56_11]
MVKEIACAICDVSSEIAVVTLYRGDVLCISCLRRLKPELYEEISGYAIASYIKSTEGGYIHVAKS